MAHFGRRAILGATRRKCTDHTHYSWGTLILWRGFWDSVDLGRVMYSVPILGWYPRFIVISWWGLRVCLNVGRFICGRRSWVGSLDE